MSKNLENAWLIEMNNDLVEFLDLHFYHIDDVEGEMEEFLNKGFLNKNYYLAFIHGFGSGRLKEKVQNYLQSHELVESYWLGTYGINAGGVTFVILKH